MNERLRPFSSENEISAKSEKISETELGDLLASVGNHEAKALTLIMMNGGNLYTRSNLGRMLIDVQDNDLTWKISHAVPSAYCKSSFEPIGLVAKEVLDENLDTYGYQITKKGEEFGIPLAGLLLDFSLKNEISLQKLFGKTSSKGKSINERNDENNIIFINRSPLSRYRILKAIISNSNLKLRAVDICNALNEKRGVVGPHLESLSKIKLINYVSRIHGESFTFYKLNPSKVSEMPPPLKNLPSLTKEIVNIINSDPNNEWTYKELSNFLKESHPKSKYSSNIISRVLVHLKEMDYLTIKKFSQLDKFHSEITLDENQKKLITEFLNVIDLFSAKDTNILEKGRQLALEIVSNPKKVNRLMSLAKENSPVANKRSNEERFEQIIGLIKVNPGISSSEILNILQKQGEKIKIHNVQHYIRQIVRDGLIHHQTQNDVYRWYVK